jgi:hypothetical protein
LVIARDRRDREIKAYADEIDKCASELDMLSRVEIDLSDDTKLIAKS